MESGEPETHPMQALFDLQDIKEYLRTEWSKFVQSENEKRKNANGNRIGSSDSSGSSSSSVGDEGIGDKVETPSTSYDWDALENKYNFLETNYTTDLHELLGELESIDNERDLWIESAYKADTYIANSRLRHTKDWSVGCEHYIETVRNDLTSCFHLIKETLERLQHEKGHTN